MLDFKRIVSNIGKVTKNVLLEMLPTNLCIMISK